MSTRLRKGLIRSTRQVAPDPSVYRAAIVSTVLLVGSGIAARALDASDQRNSKKGQSPGLLKRLPLQIGPWSGQEISLDSGVIRIAAQDDYIARLYRNEDTGEAVTFYAGMTRHPRSILRHRPAVCYPSAGWSTVSSKESFCRLPAGVAPIRVHHFLKPSIPEQRHVVIELYNINGKWTLDDPGFIERKWRGIELDRESIEALIQLQIVVPVQWDFERAQQTARGFAEQVCTEMQKVLQPH